MWSQTGRKRLQERTHLIPNTIFAASNPGSLHIDRSCLVLRLPLHSSTLFSKSVVKRHGRIRSVLTNRRNYAPGTKLIFDSCNVQQALQIPKELGVLRDCTAAFHSLS